MKIKHISLITILSIVSSCSDFLDEKAITDLTSDRIYTNVQGLKSGLIGIYHHEKTFYSNHAEGRDAFSIMCGTDLTVYRTSGDAGAAKYDNNMSPSNSVVAFNWTHHYEIVERCNSIIYYAGQLEMTEEDYNFIVGQAKAARAHAYFFLFRLFDNIYLTTEPTTTLDRTFEPADPADVYALINSDLEDAISMLDWTTSQPGRYTKAVAMHIKAKVAMFQQDWTEAASLATTLINEGPHELIPDVNDIFLPDDLDHQEAIYVYHYNLEEPGVDRLFHRMPLLFLPRYNEVVGVEFHNDMGGYAWGRLYPNDYCLSLYSEEDARLEAYYIRYFTYNNPEKMPEEVEVGDTVIVENAETAFRQIHPGSKKYWDLSKDAIFTQSVKDIILYRLSETYLMAAEALWRDDREAEALPYFNEIRGRALGVPGEVSSLNEVLIMEENARELAMEGHRWFDLKRMGKLVEQVRLYGGDDRHLEPRQNIQEYHIRRPIPQDEIDLMPGYPQNTGYENIGK
ncbi:MAG: RagB/SusD family nutrient uptake outer membrane protein [Bacteroidales bacterium]